MIDCKDCNNPKCLIYGLALKELDFVTQKKTQVKFKKGEVIIKQGNFSNYAVFLLEGFVKMYTEGQNGKNIILNVYKQNQYVGLLTIFSADFYQSTVTAIEDSAVCFVDKTAIQEIALNNGKFALSLIKKLSYMANHILANKINLFQKQIHGRIAYIILFLAKNVYESDNFALSLTRKELAEFTGVSTENVITILNEFKKDKIIDFDNKNFKVLDKNTLQKIIDRS